MIRALSLLAVFALALAWTAEARELRRPTLVVVGATPLTVRGAGFRPGDTVRVSYRAPTRLLVRRTSVSPTGGFMVRFVAGAHACDGGGIAVTARSESGVVATAKIPQPLCPPTNAP